MLFDLKTFLLEFWEDCLQNKGIALVAIAAVMIFVLIRCYRKRHLPIKTSSNELGELFVSPEAICQIVRDIGLNMNAGRVGRIKLINKKHLLCVEVHMRLFADQSFDQISMQFQESVQQNINKYLGVVKNVRVDVVLDSIDKIKSTEAALSPIKEK